MRIPSFGGGLILALGLVAATGCAETSSSVADTATAQTEAQAETDNNETGPPEDAIAVKLGSVERGSLSSLYSTSATLRADKRATVTARTQGVIRQLLMEEGDWVDEGQPMAILEDDEQRIAFEQATARAETQRREYERSEALHAQQLLSETDFETVRRESVDSDHLAGLAELTLSRTVIRATFSGRVLVRHLDVGATVSDGTAVYDIADLDPLYADVQVPERQIAQLDAGQIVRLITESNGESTEARAAIERIAPAVDPTTGTVKVTVAIKRANGLRPGSFVRVGIVTDTHEDTLLVPRSALVADGRRWHLFRLEEDNEYAVELIEVVRGFEEAERVEILEATGLARPLRPGDPIVVIGASSLDDESAVQVLPEELADAEEEAPEPVDKGENGDEEHGVAT